MTIPQIEDPRFIPATEMIGRTGAKSFQIRYSDDEVPVVWFAVAVYNETQFECAAAPDPIGAVLRLCDQIVDGGMCTHCQRPTGFIADLDPVPLGEVVCWYQWDPELKTFRRGCEGDTRA